MSIYKRSKKLNNVCYDIRGPVLQAASRLEKQGQEIIKLNIGNPAAFGFTAPTEIIAAITENFHQAEGYCESKGLLIAREAVAEHCANNGIDNITSDQVYIGNGVSELVDIALKGLLDNGDEVLIPCPDFPLWTAATRLTGATPVYYRCDEQMAWEPDLNNLQSKITKATKAIVVINPNNPTGAVYSRDTLKAIVALARQHGLILFADEIYEKILYEDTLFTPLSSLAPDLLTISFGGLSKAYRLAGFRCGWMVVSGALEEAKHYIEGLNILASLRLCPNVPAQYGVPAALGDHSSILELTSEQGRLCRQRDLAHSLLEEIPGVSCVKPKGSIYLFPKLALPIDDDERLVLKLLLQEKLLLVQGSAFGCPDNEHLRLVSLPEEKTLREAIARLARFLHSYDH